MISILIFSRNRSHYLKRAIKYWALSSWPVIISDDSANPLDIEFSSKITYLHRPGSTIQSRILELSEMAETPYAVFAPDDDFHTFSGIEKSLSYLEENQDYSMAQGLYTRFQEDVENKKLFMYQEYQYASKFLFDDLNPERRIIAAMTPPTMHYCYAVMKTDVLRNIVKTLEDVRDLSLSTFELSFNMIAMAYGKYKSLSIMYMVREYQPPARGSYISFSDWVNLSSPEGFKKWQLNIAKLYTEIIGLDLPQSLILVEEAVTTFINNNNKSESQQRQTSTKHLGNFKNKIPKRYKYLFLKLKSQWSIIKMIFLNNLNLKVFRKDWKRIKQVVLNSQ